MYTFCPDCNRQYRIRSAQLTAAQGLVICGYCGRQFNALERLSDRPQKPPVQITPHHIPGPANERSTYAPALSEEVSGYKLDTKTGPSTTVKRKEPHIDLSEALLDKGSDGGEKVRSNAWPAGVLAMLLLFAVQFSWFNRDEVLAAYPRLTPLAEELCVRYQCSLSRWNDFSSISLLNRDVREHPDYADMLLVNATMANQSGRTLPFPRIQLSLFDTNGQILAYREFNASEYLDHSIDVNKGMAPGQPVHLVLELAGPTRNAVSFEFRFL
jgi:predicted Zn finger-like uncharacterized protein